MTPRPLFLSPGKLQEPVLRKLNTADRRILLLDFDGTLAPIRSTPEKAQLPQSTKSILRKLSHHAHTNIVLVTGRSRRDIQKKIGLAGLVFVANHGFEISARGRHWIHPTARKLVPAFRTLSLRLTRSLKPVQGALVENKKHTVSVHFRNVRPSQVPAVVELVDRYVQTAGEPFAVTKGKRVIEIRPAARWDKGHAALRVLASLKATSKDFVACIGDDATDEDAFRLLRRKAVTIVVGRPRRSAATYRVDGPPGVAKFLKAILLNNVGRTEV